MIGRRGEDLDRGHTMRALWITFLVGTILAVGSAESSAEAGSSDTCANVQVREQQKSALPDCMAYEMASPPEKFSHHVGLAAVNADASRLIVQSLGGFADTPFAIGLGNSYFMSRTADRWSTRPMSLSPNEFDSIGFFRDQPDDLSKTLLLASTLEQADNLGVQFFFRGIDGSLRPASPPIRALSVPPTASAFVTYQAGTRDLSSFVFTTASTSILPGNDPVGPTNVQNMYEVAGANTDSPVIRRVDLGNTGQIAGPICSGRLIGGAGRRANAVSADGAKIFFSAHSTAAPTAACSAAGTLRVLARVNGTSTVEVSASQCTRVADPTATPPVPACNAPAAVRFEGAAEDGKTVFLSTTQQLTDDDVDTASDLYEYRFAEGASPATLKRVSAPVGGAPDAVATLLGVLNASGDGRGVYFAARGRITTTANSRGAQPAAASNNLYRYERTADHPNGRVTFVATLGTADSGLWATSRSGQRAGAGGRVLVFPSVARLTSDDTDSVADIYRYDAATDELLRVSHAKEGFAGDGNGAFAAATSIAADAGNRPPAVSSDGSTVVFVTAEALEPRDVNGADDVYRWKGGQVDLVSDGQGPEPGIQLGNGQYGVSPDGSAVVFSTAQRLVAEDVDGANDVYVARIGGGILSTSPPSTSCSGEPCQGPFGALAQSGSPASAGFSGPGNAVASPPGAGQPSGKPGIKILSAVRGSRAQFRVKVPSGGAIRVSGASITTSRRTVGKAGSYSISARLSRKTLSALQKKRRTTIAVRVQFTGSGQSPTSARVSGVVRLPGKQASKKTATRSAPRGIASPVQPLPAARKGR